MTAVTTIAFTDLRLAVRNRWILLGTATLMVMALTLAFLGSVPGGSVKASAFAVNAVSLASLAVYLVPLLALLMSYDAIVGEVERGTMMLLFTYPLDRMSFLVGKFVGHLIVLSLSVTIGFGAATVFTAISTAITSDDLLITGRLIGSTIMLGAVFLGLGYVASSLARDRASAAAISIVLWLVMVLIYDLVLLALLSAEIAGSAFSWLLVFNPGDSFRLLNLLGFDELMLVSGIAGAAQSLPTNTAGLLGILAIWIVGPLTLSYLLLRRREL